MKNLDNEDFAFETKPFVGTPVYLALYKGPANDNFLHWITHWAIKIRTLSKYSHAELQVDGECYSSSARDGGVRKKKINLASGKWDVYEVLADHKKIIDWFEKHDGDKYGWRGIIRFILPFVHQKPNEKFCFEAVAEMLGFRETEKINGSDFSDWVQTNYFKKVY